MTSRYFLNKSGCLIFSKGKLCPANGRTPFSTGNDSLPMAGRLFQPEMIRCH